MGLAWTDSKFFGASDTDAGGDGRREKTILFDSIDTAGKGDLTFYGDFASSSDPSSNRFQQDDGAVLFYSTDNGLSWNSSLSFVSDRNGKGNSGHLGFRDPNIVGLKTSRTENRSTIQGIGAANGTPLTNNFTEFSFLIPEADSVIFKILLSFDGANEEFAFDNFRLVGAIPEPSTYALIFGAGALLVVWLRKRK